MTDASKAPSEKGAGVVVLNDQITGADFGHPLVEQVDTVDVRGLYQGLLERVARLEADLEKVEDGSLVNSATQIGQTAREIYDRQTKLEGRFKDFTDLVSDEVLRLYQTRLTNTEEQVKFLTGETGRQEREDAQIDDRLTQLEEVVQSSKWTQRLNDQFDTDRKIIGRVNDLYSWRSELESNTLPVNAAKVRKMMEEQGVSYDKRLQKLEGWARGEAAPSLSALKIWKQSAEEKLREVFIRVDEALERLTNLEADKHGPNLAFLRTRVSACEERLDAIFGEDACDLDISVTAHLGREHIELARTVDKLIKAVKDLTNEFQNCDEAVALLSERVAGKDRQGWWPEVTQQRFYRGADGHYYPVKEQ